MNKKTLAIIGAIILTIALIVLVYTILNKPKYELDLEKTVLSDNNQITETVTDTEDIEVPEYLDIDFKEAVQEIGLEELGNEYDQPVQAGASTDEAIKQVEEKIQKEHSEKYDQYLESFADEPEEPLHVTSYYNM